MFCMKCGAKLIDGAKFCLKCGAPVAVSSQHFAGEPPAPQGGQPVQPTPHKPQGNPPTEQPVSVPPGTQANGTPPNTAYPSARGGVPRLLLKGNQSPRGSR